jgi:light-regulated signal transduction histidine kinase (bacteriophytochrome)
VRGDRSLLHQVWVNLLSNAIKYTRPREQARIEVAAVEEDKELIFWVKDNGVGFDMAYADKLFGVFQRLHTVQEFEGTGVGLANVRRIVQKHGGRTWAEAQREQGAAIFFSLPVLHAERVFDQPHATQ